MQMINKTLGSPNGSNGDFVTRWLRLAVAIVAGLLACATVEAQSVEVQPTIAVQHAVNPAVQGPIRDAVAERLANRIESRLETDRQAISGIFSELGNRFDTFGRTIGGRLDGQDSRFRRFEEREKGRWQIWQEERTKRNEADEATRQEIARMQSEIARANKHRPMWRFLTFALIAGAGLLVWFS